MSVERPVPADYVAQNQEFWRNAKRGIISRPLELTHTAGLIHDRVVKTFGLENNHEPILTLSLVFDKPKTPSSCFVYEERYPEDVREEDREDYSRGIGRITEYATNVATTDFIRRNTDVPLFNLATQVYTRFADLVTYELLLNGTYREMSRIAWMAKQNGKDYRKALYAGLFKHDIDPINEIIADSQEFLGCADINELAIKLGKNRFKKPDILKWMGKLEVERTDGPVKSNIKNCIISVFAGGVFRSPGVTEVSAAMLPLFAAETAAIYIARGNMDAGLLAQNLAVVTAITMAATPYAATHEMLHGFSSSKDYMGFIPVHLIEKQVTPYFIRLEPAEQPRDVI